MQLRSDIAAKLKAWDKYGVKCVLFDAMKRTVFENLFCVECNISHNDYGYIIGFERESCSYVYEEPKFWERPTIEQCSIAYIASENEPYNIFFEMNMQKQNFITHNVIFYGGESKETPTKMLLENPPINMAYARNKIMNEVETEYVFSLDVDTTGTLEQYEKILDMYASYKHHGIMNLRCIDPQKSFRVGNSFYFGKTKRMKINKFNEDFKSFFYEDTEYMLNWGRLNIPLILVDVDLERAAHTKVVNQKYNEANSKIFVEILHKGRFS
jgi:hypothetical protein